MPGLGQPGDRRAREAISRVFLEHVIGGKGLSARRDFARMVRMPTPEAVLRGVRLLAARRPGPRGGGDTIVVDVGGATTDVHSDSGERPLRQGSSSRCCLGAADSAYGRGRPRPARRRAEGVLDADRPWLSEQSTRRDGGAGEAAERPRPTPAWVPDDPQRRSSSIGCLRSVRDATRSPVTAGRCCSPGRARGVHRPWSRRPRPARSRRVIGTGGVFATVRRRGDSSSARLGAAARARSPRAPARSRSTRGYVLAAAGLLETIDPGAESGAWRTVAGRRRWLKQKLDTVTSQW